jgi:uroporphyrinogen decarboxylase
MNKRERLEKTIAGEPTDRTPVTLWRHFPGDDQRAADLARSVIDFQHTYDWDFSVVMPANSYCVADYGAFDQWNGSSDGIRTRSKHAIQRSLDWTELRTLDPARGMFGRIQESVQLIASTLAEETPIVVTIYSPLSQACDLAGKETLLRHMRTQADRVHTGLNVLTESTLRFIDALRRTPIAGILYMIPHANYAELSEEEYQGFGLAYDRKLIDSIPSKFWLNITHLSGALPMFKFASVFKTQALGWHDRDNEPSLPIGKTLFSGAVCGGLSVQDHMLLGTPTTVRDAAREAIQQIGSRGLILAPGGTIPVTTPLSNLRALRESVGAG